MLAEQIRRRQPPRRAFAGLIAGLVFGDLGDNGAMVLFPVLAAATARSPDFVAVVAATLSIPWAVCSVPAGVLVDRLSRKCVMIVSFLSSAAALGLLAVLDAGSLPLRLPLVAVGLAVGVGQVFGNTAASAALPSVAQGDIEKANSWLFGAQNVVGRLGGPPLVGSLAALALWSAAAASAAAYAAAALIVWHTARGLRYERPGQVRAAPDRSRVPLARQMRDGVAYVVHDPLLRSLAVAAGILNVAIQAAMTVAVLFVVSPGPLRGSRVDYGLVVSAFALGGLAGAAAARRGIAAFGRGATAGAGVSLIAAGLGCAAAAGGWPEVAACFGLAGAGSSLWDVTTISLRQRLVPDAMLGRVTGVYRSIALGGLAAGALLAGRAAGAVGLRGVFGLAGAVTLASLAVILVVRRAERVLAEEASGR